MGFHNGVPITVVSGLQSMLTPTESTSRRRAEEGAQFEARNAAKISNCRVRQRRGSA
jgi:hypothetical protein